MPRPIIVLIVTLTILVPAAPVVGEETQDSIVVDGTLHSPDEIFRLLERSELAYVIRMTDTLEQIIGKPERLVLDPWLLVADDEGNAAVAQYEFSDSILAALKAGDLDYKNGRYQSAAAHYRRAHELSPNSSPPLTYLGNTYYMAGQFDSARVILNRALERNPDDYQALWFLAETYWELDSLEAAWRTMCRAHLMNRNHEEIRKSIAQLRADMGDAWEYFEFTPHYQVYADSTDTTTIHILTDNESLGYAMVKALWRFEPGYTERMAPGAHFLGPFNMLEEREALVMSIAYMDDNVPIEEIIDEGFIDAFILYEVVGPIEPRLLMILSEETLSHLTDYIDRYH
ncbi:tetratricopeptide repeat protein [candidate division GN15 bacterium]|nr:tetratricopeptide repeat protein [candidate division GN15 bacterium]